MRRLLLLLLVFCPIRVAVGRTAPAGQSPHPAVVRITALERNGASMGSGTLVDVNHSYGLVVTNWHVVRDAAGPILVTFSNGFCSPARVLATDRDWDLAALAIWRPNVEPIPLSDRAPRPGELLTIAGYGGRGWYRRAAGRCTQYVSPGANHPHEMVELAASARQGDSGGPILNSRGEMAGVLFGTAFGRTTGSYCGRVRWFLASNSGAFEQLPARRTVPSGEVQIAQDADRQPAGMVAAAETPSTTLVKATSGWSEPAVAELPRGEQTPTVDIATPMATEPVTIDRAEQIKTILAAIGLLAVLFHSLRLLGAAVE